MYAYVVENNIGFNNLSTLFKTSSDPHHNLINNNRLVQQFNNIPNYVNVYGGSNYNNLGQTRNLLYTEILKLNCQCTESYPPHHHHLIFACCVAVAGAHYTHRGNELTLVICFYVNVLLVLIHLLNPHIHTITLYVQKYRKFPYELCMKISSFRSCSSLIFVCNSRNSNSESRENEMDGWKKHKAKF